MWALRSPAREGLLCAAVAAVAAALLAWLAPPGGDLAAHLYQRLLFVSHGFTLWDDYWYAGRYSFVGYSVLYYPIAAVLGIRVLAVLEVALAAGAFALLLEREWGSPARWASRAFALLWAGVLITGEFPFALGVALALLALLALQSGHHWGFAVLTLLTLAASPVALVLLGAVLAGVALSRRAPLRRHRLPVLALAVAGAVELLLLRLFPIGGTLGFPVSEAAPAIAFCLGGIALAWRVPRAGVLRGILALYLVAIVVAWAIPSALGQDVTRMRLLSLPLVLLIAGLRGWRPLPVALTVVALALAWNVGPLAGGWARGAADTASNAVMWREPVAYLHAHLRPGYRVEAVDTTEHWPAFYLARARIPIVRGWFRQDDFPLDALLYKRLSPAAYLRWLRKLGVAYVVLTRSPPDYSSQREAALVRSDRVHLPLVFATRKVSIYAVPRPQPIVTGPGRPVVLSLRESRLVARLPRAGTYRIAVRWSPYWSTTTGCLARTSEGMLRLRTRQAATVRIGFDVDAGALLRALAGTAPSCRYPTSRTSSSSGLRFARSDHSPALRFAGFRGLAG